MSLDWQPVELLKADHFGRVERGYLSEIGPATAWIGRNTSAAPWYTRPLARFLAKREARALRVLTGLAGIPQWQSWQEGLLLRSYLEGRPMHLAQPKDRTWFFRAQRFLVAMHRRGVVHNDLAKEPNWIVTPDGYPALVDFQLATVHRRRGRWFRHAAREDLRHLLKHKRTYCPHALTARERQLLSQVGWVAQLWRWTGKPMYLGLTRGLLRWKDREGAGDRSSD